MSVKISGLVWELKLEPMDKLVLLALADHADHDGQHIRPGNDLLVAKTGLSRQTISTKLAKFIELGILTEDSDGVGRGRKKEFSVETRHLARHAYFEQKDAHKKSKQLAPFPELKGQAACSFSNAEKGQVADKKGQAALQKGQAVDMPPIRTRALNRHEPSEEPSSVRAARTRVQEADGVALIELVRRYVQAEMPHVEHAGVYASKAVRNRYPLIEKARAWALAQLDALDAPATPAATVPPSEVAVNPPVQVSALVEALFVAQGWLLEPALPAQREAAEKAARQLAVYADSSTPALPELVARADAFYAQSGKANWGLPYLASDWPQIYRWLNRAEGKGNAFVGAHSERVLPAAAPSAWESEYDGEAAADAWWVALSDEERGALINAARGALFAKLPRAREWDAATIEQTVRATLRREWMEQQPAATRELAA